MARLGRSYAAEPIWRIPVVETSTPPTAAQTGAATVGLTGAGLHAAVSVVARRSTVLVSARQSHPRRWPMSVPYVAAAPVEVAVLTGRTGVGAVGFATAGRGTKVAATGGVNAV